MRALVISVAVAVLSDRARQENEARHGPGSTVMTAYWVSRGATASVHLPKPKPELFAWLTEGPKGANAHRRRQWDAQRRDQRGEARLLQLGGEWDDPEFMFVQIDGTWHPARSDANGGPSNAWSWVHHRDQFKRFAAAFLADGTHNTKIW